MTKSVLAACTLAVCFGALATPAFACWDNTDEIIAKLDELNLDTNQMRAIFALRDEQQGVIERSHQEGLGCRHHENAEAEFKKAAVGVLKDDQFETYMGRKRTETESLSYEIYLLKCEIAALESELASYTPATKSGCCASKQAKAECEPAACDSEKKKSCCPSKTQQ